ncbi:MAG: hypothetical protein JRH06_15390 [Deltaproteobacteria bacterium]|nr:hypothetical protein [Deltaproteobacteria bacterium]
MKKKKKKKRRRKTSLGSRSDPVPALEEKATQCLAEEKYRQARDCFKRLCGYDRDKYLPQLIEANEGLAFKMIKGGKFGYAKTILDQMRSLGASNHRVNLIGVLLALHQGDYGAAVTAASDYLAEARDEGWGDIPLFVFDALVLSFEFIEKGLPLSNSIKEEVRAIQSALKLVSEEHYDEALAAVRTINLRSPFSQWKLFLKGLCAFYQGEDEKARKAFTRLPGGCVPAKAAYPYLVLLDGAKCLDKHHRRLESLGLMCWIAGEKRLETVLPKAEYLWQIGRFLDSYLYVRNNLEEFPSQRPGIVQELSSFYLKVPFHMQEEDAERYIDSFDRILDKKHIREFEKLMILKTLCLYFEKTLGHDPALKGLWEDFLRTYHYVYGRNPDLEALVYAHLGDLFSEEISSYDPFFFFGRRRQRRSQVRNAGLAEACYERSIRLNPGDKEAYVSLLDLYEKVGEKSKLNRKLDEFIRLFPEDKDMLYKAGLRCMERRALIKGMNYLEKAIQLDPLDSQIRQAFITCCTKAALEYAGNHRMEKCRNLLPRALEWSEARLEDFGRGRAYVNARWASMELLGGDAKRAEILLDRGKSLVNNNPKFHFFTWLVARSYGVPSTRLEKIKKLVDEEFSGPASPDKLVAFVETLSYFTQYQALDRRGLGQEIKRIRRYMRKAAKGLLSREQAKIVVEFALENGEKDVALEYAEKVLKDNPDDAYFRYLQYEIDKRPWVLESRRSDLCKLEKILELAEKERDQELIMRIRREIEQLRFAERHLGDFLVEDLDDDDYYDMDYPDEMPHNNHFDEVSDHSTPVKNPAVNKRRKSRKPARVEQLDLFDELET